MDKENKYSHFMANYTFPPLDQKIYLGILNMKIIKIFR